MKNIKPLIRRFTVSRPLAPCPHCDGISKRHSIGRRRLWEVGITRPTILEATYSKHYCPACNKHFSLRLDYLARPSCRFTNRVRRCAIDAVIRSGLTLEAASVYMRARHFVHIPPTTLHAWVVDELYFDGVGGAPVARLAAGASVC